MRIRSLLALAALPVSVAACDTEGLTMDGFCLDGCGTGREPLVPYIVGVPRESVWMEPIGPAGGHYARVPVGASFPVHLLHGRLAIPHDSDTVRAVTWSATRPSVARVQAGAGGAATVTAVGEGRTRIRANGDEPTLWACAPDACYRIDEIEVVR